MSQIKTTQGTKNYVAQEIDKVKSDIDNRLSGLKIVKTTQAEYDALATKDPNTLYLITE